MANHASSVRDYTDPYLRTYTSPPPTGDGVCEVCHAATGLRYDGTHWLRCWSCGRTRSDVVYPIELVVPISLYRVGEQLHTVLKDYKRSPNARVRERHLLQVGSILHRFVAQHRGCIEGASREWETVTIVPSKTPSADPHPLETAIMLSDPLASEYRRLLEPDEVSTIGRATASDTGFRVTEDVADLDVLLIDDTFTSGATFQSAASALGLAGARVAAGVVIGRVVDTSNDDYPEKLELWEQQRAELFSFETCCLE